MTVYFYYTYFLLFGTCTYSKFMSISINVCSIIILQYIWSVFYLCKKVLWWILFRIFIKLEQILFRVVCARGDDSS